MSDVHDNLAIVAADLDKLGLDLMRGNRVVSGLELFDFSRRIIRAAAIEAAKLIPATRIEFSDERGRRAIAAGWVKPREGQP